MSQSPFYMLVTVVAVAELSRQFESRVGQLLSRGKSVFDSLFRLLLYVATVLRRVAPSSATATVVYNT
jgi:hypothetical protein